MTLRLRNGQIEVITVHSNLPEPAEIQIGAERALMADEAPRETNLLLQKHKWRNSGKFSSLKLKSNDNNHNAATKSSRNDHFQSFKRLLSGLHNSRLD